jgi:proteic killer suppression protein
MRELSAQVGCCTHRHQPCSVIIKPSCLEQFGRPLVGQFGVTIGDGGAARGATRYNSHMIRSFRHKGVERFFKSGSRGGIQAAHAPRLARQLAALDAASRPEDMNRPGWDWHPLKGGLSGHWSVSVNGNWRLTFAFENGDAVLVDYQDYH